MQARSFLADQQWSNKTHADRIAWINQYGDRIARARGAFVLAAEAYAKEIKSIGANERLEFSAADLIESVLDRTDVMLADEVRMWLDC